MDIIYKKRFIKRSVSFQEPLQDLQLVEEEIVKLLPLSNEDSRDENESICYDISNYMYYLSDNEELVSYSDPNDPPQIPKWEEKTLSYVKSNIGNLVY